jgi:hypothetical protein
MALAAAHMVALADDPSVGTHNHSPHHRVGLRILLPVTGQLDAPSHISLVISHHIRLFVISFLSRSANIYLAAKIIQSSDICKEICKKFPASYVSIFSTSTCEEVVDAQRIAVSTNLPDGRLDERTRHRLLPAYEVSYILRAIY